VINDFFTPVVNLTLETVQYGGETFEFRMIDPNHYAVVSQASGERVGAVTYRGPDHVRSVPSGGMGDAIVMAKVARAYADALRRAGRFPL
jgi:hypothetical protein